MTTEDGLRQIREFDFSDPTPLFGLEDLARLHKRAAQFPGWKDR